MLYEDKFVIFQYEMLTHIYEVNASMVYIFLFQLQLLNHLVEFGNTESVDQKI